MAPRVWFITGASSGLGLAVTTEVLEKGDIAVATLRNPSKAPELTALSAKFPSTLLILELDVTKTPSIAKAFAQAIEKFNRVDVVFNNAGWVIATEAEATPEDAARSMFDVNFWAVANVSQEAVRVFREVNPKNGSIGGIILQSSSNLGVEGGPAVAYYSATKAAVISYSDGLRAELDPEWHINIISLAFGYFYTKALDSTVKPPAHPAYRSDLPSHMVRAFANAGRSPGGAEPADGAAVIWKLIAETEPKDLPTLLPLGNDSVAATRRAAEAREAAANKGEEVSKDLKVATAETLPADSKPAEEKPATGTTKSKESTGDAKKSRRISTLFGKIKKALK